MTWPPRISGSDEKDETAMGGEGKGRKSVEAGCIHDAAARVSAQGERFCGVARSRTQLPPWLRKLAVVLMRPICLALPHVRLIKGLLG